MWPAGGAGAGLACVSPTCVPAASQHGAFAEQACIRSCRADTLGDAKASGCLLRRGGQRIPPHVSWHLVRCIATIGRFENQRPAQKKPLEPGSHPALHASPSWCEMRVVKIVFVFAVSCCDEAPSRLCQATWLDGALALVWEMADMWDTHTGRVLPRARSATAAPGTSVWTRRPSSPSRATSPAMRVRAACVWEAPLSRGLVELALHVSSAGIVFGLVVGATPSCIHVDASLKSAAF